MVRLYLLLFLLGIALAVVALIGCLSAEADEIRALPRPVWAVLIVFVPLAGALAWFAAGRPLPVDAAAGHHGGRAVPRRPLAPDDDPDFLRSLHPDESRRDRELFERWEEDLRKRRDEDG
jgi:hypothetical protein